MKPPPPPAPPAAPPAPPPPSEKKKKKRRSEVQEESPPPPPPPSEKKKKRRSEVQEESPAPPPPPSPPHPLSEKKKKKKKRRSEVLEESPPPPPPSEKKKKRRRSEVQEQSPAPPSSPSSPSEKKKKKKKKKRRSEVLEESPAPPPPSEKKKKRRRSEVLEESPAPPPPSEKKKKMRRSEVLEESPPPPPSSPPPSEEKKKRRSEVQEESPAPPAPSSPSSLQDHQEEEQFREMGLTSDLVEELQEFFPSVKTSSVERVRKLIRYDLHRFRTFKQQGLAPRTGRYSREENQQICDNVADFLVLTGIPSAQHLLFPRRFGEQEAELRRLKTQHHFLHRIAAGIPRTCEQVYIRARKLFDQTNHLGRFSEAELGTLRKLHQLHGNDWRRISDQMGRSVYALQKRFSSLSTRQGPWDLAEESRLKKAVRTHLVTLVQQNPGSGLTRDQLYAKLPWKKISEQVQTRAWTQCRLKWFSILRLRLAPGRRVFNHGTSGTLAKIQLINTLYQMDVDDMADVDWTIVADNIGHVTPSCVQKTFQRLKFHKVPHRTTLSFGEIVDFLHDSVLPELEARLKSSIDEGAGHRVEGAGHRVEGAGHRVEGAGLEHDHQLSFIFTEEEDEEEEEVEVDNSGLPVGLQLHSRG